MELLKRTGVKISGKRAVVIGRSNIVGMPVALLLQAEDATVTVVHSRTPAPEVQCNTITSPRLGASQQIPENDKSVCLLFSCTLHGSMVPRKFTQVYRHRQSHAFSATPSTNGCAANMHSATGFCLVLSSCLRAAYNAL